MHKVPNTIYAVDFHKATHISAGNKTHISCDFDLNWWETLIWYLWIKPATLIYHYLQSWLYQIYISNIVIKVITISGWGDKKNHSDFLKS